MESRKIRSSAQSLFTNAVWELSLMSWNGSPLVENDSKSPIAGILYIICPNNVFYLCSTLLESHAQLLFSSE